MEGLEGHDRAEEDVSTTTRSNPIDELPELTENDAEQIITLEDNREFNCAKYFFERVLGRAYLVLTVFYLYVLVICFLVIASCESIAASDNRDDGDSSSETEGNVLKENDGPENEEMEDVDTDKMTQVARDDAVLVLRGHTAETLAIDASPTNKNYIITGAMDDVGLIWDLEMQSSIAKVDGAKDSVSTVAFSHDGKYAAFGSENGAISIVFMDGSTAPGTPLDGPGDTIHFLSWHPRGPVLLAGSADSVAYMWNAPKYKFMMAFAGHEDAVSCGGFTGDGKLVVTGSLDSSVRVWNPSTGEALVRIQTGVAGLRGIFHGADIHCLSLGSEGSTANMLIASGCAAGDVYITHRESAQIICRLPRHEGGVESISFSPSTVRPTLLASAGADGIVRIWDVESSSERCKFNHGGVISKVLWHATLPVLASGSSDGTVAVWNCMSGQRIAHFAGHETFISDICFAGAGNFVASTSGDGTVRLFDLSNILSST